MPSSAEADFCGEVMGVAQRMGLLVHWCSDSRKCYGDKGIPDLTIIGPGGFLWAECKMEDGETSAEQDRWFWAIGEATGSVTNAVIWRPHHLEDGTIEKELERLAKPPHVARARARGYGGYRLPPGRRGSTT